MTVTPVATSVLTEKETANVRVPKQTLGQEDFLKLITVQLAQQDPLKPMEDTNFMAQMAQFSAMEQSSQMARDMAGLRADFSLQSAAATIGREVTLQNGDQTVTGTVDSVSNANGTARVSVGGELYPFSSIIRVAPQAAAPQA